MRTRCFLGHALLAQDGRKTGRGEVSGPAEAGWDTSVASPGWLSPKPTAFANCCCGQRPPTPPPGGRLPAAGQQADDVLVMAGSGAPMGGVLG